MFRLFLVALHHLWLLNWAPVSPSELKSTATDLCWCFWRNVWPPQTLTSAVLVGYILSFLIQGKQMFIRSSLAHESRLHLIVLILLRLLEISQVVWWRIPHFFRDGCPLKSGFILRPSTLFRERKWGLLLANFQVLLVDFILSLTLSLQIFLHCDLMANDIRSVMVDGKACHYVKERRRFSFCVVVIWGQMSTRDGFVGFMIIDCYRWELLRVLCVHAVSRPTRGGQTRQTVRLLDFTHISSHLEQTNFLLQVFLHTRFSSLL